MVYSRETEHLCLRPPIHGIGRDPFCRELGDNTPDLLIPNPDHHIIISEGGGKKEKERSLLISAQDVQDESIKKHAPVAPHYASRERQPARLHHAHPQPRRACLPLPEAQQNRV